jgi:Tfp pilus assembly protein PilV
MHSSISDKAAAGGARPRAGFTLLEVIAAIILIDVGLLALVAGSAVLVRQTSELRARSAALHVASNRLELLGAAGCAGADGRALLSNGTKEHWSAAVESNAVRELRDTVTFFVGTASKSLVLRTKIPC